MLATKINIEQINNLVLNHECFDYSVSKYLDFEMNWETHEIPDLQAERVIIFDSKNTKNGNGWGWYIINMDIDKDDEETWLFAKLWIKNIINNVINIKCIILSKH